MSLILGSAIAVLLVAIFGVLMAKFALRHGSLPALSREPQLKDPYALVWWQDLQDLGYEFHLASGEVWRGRVASFHRWPDGMDESHGVPMDHWNKLERYRRRIEWKEPEIWALHGHTLVDWTAMERAYQLKLLNGSVWQFNEKSEGLGEDNEMAWHRISSPDGVVFESLNRVRASLNSHLEQIRKAEARAAAVGNAVSGTEGVMVQHVSGCSVCGTHSNLLGDAAGNHLICTLCAKGQVLNARF